MKDHGSKSKLLMGLFIVLAGFLFLFNRMDLLSDSFADIVFSFQMLLLAIGIIAVGSYVRNVVGWILIVIGGGFLLADMAGISAGFNEVFWPALVIIIGLVIIFKSSGRSFLHGKWQKKPHYLSEVKNDEEFEDVAVFGGGDKSYTLKNLRSGKIVAIFGGSEIDFSETEISDEGAVIEVFYMFGGSTLWVPADWNVKTDVVSIFGGFEEKRHPTKSAAENGKKLYVKGMALFGGGEIKRL
ncbi:MAG: cell wall-active antibiotics response protein [Bacteroidales bacterium]|nr:cell wall-active antibiotics response protein [Bacteroidales bacterium]MCF8334839.1 cell wall-active antibiotics response protein [Bacteroidales bacterium]